MKIVVLCIAIALAGCVSTPASVPYPSTPREEVLTQAHMQCQPPAVWEAMRDGTFACADPSSIVAPAHLQKECAPPARVVRMNGIWTCGIPANGYAGTYGGYPYPQWVTPQHYWGVPAYPGADQFWFRTRNFSYYSRR